MRVSFRHVLLVALAIGFLIDAVVGLVALVAQPLLQPLFDIPLKDSAVTMIAGGELVVASCIYAFVFRDPKRWQPFLWVLALDQIFGVLLPAVAMLQGTAPVTFKTVAPMPLQLALVIVYIIAARRPATRAG